MYRSDFSTRNVLSIGTRSGWRGPGATEHSGKRSTGAGEFVQLNQSPQGGLRSGINKAALYADATPALVQSTNAESRVRSGAV